MERWIAVLFVGGLVIGANALVDVVQPEVDREIALAQMSDDGAATEMRLRHRTNWFRSLSWLAPGVLAAWLFRKEIVSVFRRGGSGGTSEGKAAGKTLATMLLAGVCLTSTGCLRPYDTPEFVEVETSEVAFLVPLRSDTSDQTAVSSEEFLKEHLVLAKKVEIPHEWIQTGRWYTNGEWKGTMRLIKVDRAPVTREWAAESGRGTSTSDQAIWVESSDSVGFSTGVTCTARIPDRESAIRFLANYPNGSLATVMDSEIRARVQKNMATYAADWSMDELRPKKNEMMEIVETDVTSFFRERGIEITTIGLFGGFTYENPKIQESIDAVFEAQQDEEVAKAEKVAQVERNEAIKLAAEGAAEAAKLKAEGEAEAAKLAAAGRAEAIQTVADANAYEIEKALENQEMYLNLKKLELEETRLERWDGRYPHYMVTLDGANETGTGVLLPPVAPGR